MERGLLSDVTFRKYDNNTSSYLFDKRFMDVMYEIFNNINERVNRHVISVREIFLGLVCQNKRVKCAMNQSPVSQTKVNIKA